MHLLVRTLGAKELCRAVIQTINEKIIRTNKVDISFSFLQIKIENSITIFSKWNFSPWNFMFFIEMCRDDEVLCVKAGSEPSSFLLSGHRSGRHSQEVQLDLRIDYSQ